MIMASDSLQKHSIFLFVKKSSWASYKHSINQGVYNITVKQIDRQLARTCNDINRFKELTFHNIRNIFYSLEDPIDGPIFNLEENSQPSTLSKATA